MRLTFAWNKHTIMTSQLLKNELCMLATPSNRLSRDERGVAYIAGTKMKVRQIVVEKNVWGLTPEEIQQGHEYLALAYYDERANFCKEKVNDGYNRNQAL